MTFDWKKICIVLGAVLLAIAAFKLLPFWVSLTALGCAVGGFICGVYWKSKDDEESKE